MSWGHPPGHPPPGAPQPGPHPSGSQPHGSQAHPYGPHGAHPSHGAHAQGPAGAHAQGPHGPHPHAGARRPISPGDWRYQPAPGQVPWQAPPQPAIARPASPFTFQHVKISPEELPRMLGEMQAQIDRRSLHHNLFYAALIVPIAIAILVPPIAIFGTILGIVLFVRGRSKIVRKRHKLDFLRGVMDELRDELHPRAPVRFDFDLTAYDEKSKLTRTARSSAGNTKSYYSDKWLRLRVVLADRTRVELVRQVGIKTKKGANQHEKRRLFLTVTPNPRRYQPMLGEPMAAKLRWQVEGAIVQGFHNRPEQVAVHVTHHTQDIALRVAQFDAEILPREVTVILGAVMVHLRERCATALLR